MFSNPDIGEICDLLREVRTIAMVGLSPLQKRPSYRIARGLQGAALQNRSGPPAGSKDSG